MCHVVTQHCGFVIQLALTLLTDYLASLFVLIRKGHLKVVQFLIEGKHCNAEANDEDGQTPLDHAVRYTQYYDIISL